VWKPSVMPLFLVNRHIVAIFFPGMEGIAERDERSESGEAQIGDHAQQPGSQLPAFSLVEMFFQQQVAELLFEAVNHFQRGVFPQIGREALMLVGLQIMAMAAHQGE